MLACNAGTLPATELFERVRGKAVADAEYSSSLLGLDKPVG